MSSADIKKICVLCAGQGNPPLTSQRIGQYVKEGMPMLGRNSYEVLACLYWCLGRARRASARKETENSDGSISGIQGERKRLLKNQADREELEMMTLQGKLVSIEDWEKATIDNNIAIRARILSVPARVAPRLVGETSRVMIQGLIEKEIKQALSAIAEGE